MTFALLSPPPFLALQICVGAAVGAVAGYAYFAALWRNVTLIETGATLWAMLLFSARILLLALTLYALVRIGALALLAGAVGLLAARRLTLKRFGGQS